eukprot:1152698-Pelagomonas_calceolata.AAC.15
MPSNPSMAKNLHQLNSQTKIPSLGIACPIPHQQTACAFDAITSYQQLTAEHDCCLALLVSLAAAAAAAAAPTAAHTIVLTCMLCHRCIGQRC